MIRYYKVKSDQDIKLFEKIRREGVELFVCSVDGPPDWSERDLAVLILDDGVPQALQADASTVSNPDREIIRSAISVSLASGASLVLCANLSEKRTDESILFLRDQGILFSRVFALVDQIVDVGGHEVPTGIDLLQRLVSHGVSPGNIAIFSKVEASQTGSGFRYIAKPVVRSFSSSSLTPLPDVTERLALELRSWIARRADTLTRAAVEFVTLPGKAQAPWFSPTARAHNEGEPGFDEHRNAASLLIPGLTTEQYKRLLGSSDPLQATESVIKSRNSMASQKVVRHVLNELLSLGSVEFIESSEPNLPVYFPVRPGFAFLLALAEFLRVVATESRHPIPTTFRRYRPNSKKRPFFAAEFGISLDFETITDLTLNQDSVDGGDLATSSDSLRRARFRLPMHESTRASQLLTGSQQPVAQFIQTKNGLTLVWKV